MSTRQPSLFDRLSPSQIAWEIARVGVLAFMIALIVPPILYAIFISVSPEGTFTNPFHIVPPLDNLQFKWYVQAFNDLSTPLINTYIRATGSTIIGLAVSIPSAYVIARRRFPYRKLGFYWIVGVQVFPIVIIVVPLMAIFFTLNLNDTIIGLWLADQLFIIPLSLWILRDFFNGMPENLEEAAQMYGCTQFSAFVRVILPLTLPAILAVGFLAFVHGWNEYVFAQLISGQESRPAIIQLTNLANPSTQVHWGRGMAKTVILAAPPALLYLFARSSMQEAFAFN